MSPPKFRGCGFAGGAHKGTSSFSSAVAGWQPKAPVGQCARDTLKVWHPQVRLQSREAALLPSFIRARKKHINFFNINFVAPAQNPNLGPLEKLYVPHFLGKNAKKGPTSTLSGGSSGSKTGSQTGHFRPHKFSLSFFSRKGQF